MESALRSMMSSSMACKPYGSSSSSNFTGAKTRSFPQPPQPPLLPLPAQAPSPQGSFGPAARAKKPRRNAAPGAASAPITVAAAPSRKRVAPAADELEAVGWAETGSLHSVSPPPSSVPMPTSSLLATVAPGRKAAPAACAVNVDVGATDELRRLLRL